MTVGLPVAGAAGLLAGTAYLTYGGVTSVIPWTAVAWLTLIAVTGGLLIAAATGAGLGGRVQPADLRRE